MPQPDLGEALGLFGGPLEFATVEGVLPGWAADALDRWLQAARETIADLLHENECPSVHIYATNGTWTSVRLTPLGNGDMLVTLPAGLLIRLWTAYRLLLSYEPYDDVSMTLVGSLEDPTAPDRPTPPRLRPLLRDFIDPAIWWSQIGCLNRCVSNRDRDEDAALLMFASLETVLSHEVAHILRRHLAIRSSFEGVEAASACNVTNVRRALEVDADFVAGLILGASRRPLLEKELAESLKMLAFGISGLLALFDPAYLRVFDDFEAADYYHPKIRRGAYVGGVRRSLPENDSGPACEAINDGIGWFDELMSRLEVDAFVGKFGKVSADRGSPIINPLRRLAFQPTYEEDAEAADRDLLWANDQYRSRHGEVRWPQP